MKDLRFIKHATDTLHNNQFALLIQKEGYKGYGIYWALMENLFGQPQYQSPLQTIGLLATRLGLRKTVLLRIIKEYGLFQLTETHFAAPQLANSQQRTTRACQQAGTTEQVSLRKEEEHTNLGQTQTNLPQSAGKHTLNEHTTGTQRNYLPCNSLTINKTSDTQEKTREEKEKKKNTHTQKNVRQRETVARDEKKTETQTTTQADIPREQQRIRQIIEQIPRQTHWLGNIAKNTSHGKQVIRYLQPLLTDFETYLCLRAQENTVQTIEDAKRRFFYWSGSQQGKESITRLRQTAAPPGEDIYRYEQRTQGKRTYFGRPIPDHAPPRPTDRAVWDDQAREWIL